MARPPMPPRRRPRATRGAWWAVAGGCFLAAILLSWTEGARDLRLEGLAILIAVLGCAALLRAVRPTRPPG